MKAVKFSRPRRQPVEVNLTPLIDVVFLLLIFFMVSTTFETRQALELTLPESAGGVAVEEGAPVVLSISAAGDYRLGGRELAAGRLAEALAAEAGPAREHGLVVEADGRASHASVVHALDQAGLLGIRRVRIATTELSSTATETP